MLKKHFSIIYKIKIKIKTTTMGLKNELKYCPVPEGNTCIAEPNLEVFPLRIIQWRASLVFLLKVFKNNLKSDETYKVSLFHYQMTTNSAVNRILACVINNCNNSYYQSQI